MAYTINWLGKGVYVKHSGTVTLACIRSQDDSMYNDDRYEYLEYQIIDYSDVTTSTITKEDVHQISAYELGASHWKKNMRVAWVVTDPDIIKLIKVFIRKLTNSSWAFNIFKSVEEAENWCRKRL